MSITNAIGPYRTWLPIIGACAVAIVLADWYVRLRRQTVTRQAAVGYVALMACNPLVLYAATQSFHDAIALLGYYALGLTAYRLRERPDVRTMVAFAIALAILVVCDARSMYLVPALVPAIALLVDPRALEQSPWGIYLLILFPVVVVIASGLYLGWIFAGDALVLASSPSSPLRGMMAEAGSISWLRAYGGDWERTAGIGIAALAGVFPAAVWILALLRRRRLELWPHVVLIVVPIFGLTFGTFVFFPPHPATFMLLLAVPTMLGARFVLTTPVRRRVYATLLAAGIATGGMLMHYRPSPDMARWNHRLSRVLPSFMSIRYEHSDR